MVKFDLDPFFKVTVVKLEVKLGQFQQNIPYVIKYAHFVTTYREQPPII